MGYSLTENPVKEPTEDLLCDDGALGGTKDATTPDLLNAGRDSSEKRQHSNDRSRSPNKDPSDAKRETIPEFVQVRNIGQIYQIFCDANRKNKILLKSQLGEEYFQTEEHKKKLMHQNIKDDIILVQFKLVRRENGKAHNV